MRWKLDENLGRRGMLALAQSGEDVATVLGQDLCGTSDATLAEVCRAEDRILITLDRDFADTLRFPPSRFRGIVVLRLHEPLTVAAIEGAVERVVQASAGRAISGRLWIVDARRIREFAGTGTE